MCRCLNVSTSGFHAWSKRSTSSREADNQRLLVRIREYHEASGGVMGMPRMHEELSYDGETVSPNRVVRLMARHGLFGVPQRRPFRNKRTGVRPDHVRNHLERDFVALEPNTRWVHVAIRAWRIAIRAGAHAHDRQRASLAQPLVDHLPHQLAPSRCAHHFFRKASLMTSFSSTCSASSFFSRPFSVSSHFNRLASGTLMPPNLLRHR